MDEIACVIPTVRPKSWKTFIKAWQPQFNKYKVEVIKVEDGDNPILTHRGKKYTVKQIMGKSANLIFNKNDGVRNLGFAYIAKFLPNIETIITLDDDTLPLPNSISGHLSVLKRHFPLDWMSTATDYVRGIPYGVRNQGECVVSHGVWKGVMDWDAPTQLVKGNRQLKFYKGAIPRGIYFPFCGMNVAFKRKMLPYMYYAPMGYRVGMDRFADIWLGINLKRVCDKNNWAIATGFSTIRHERASNVWTNLKKEVKGLILNETYWEGDTKDDYFKLYDKCRKLWQKLKY